MGTHDAKSRVISLQVDFFGLSRLHLEKEGYLLLKS